MILSGARIHITGIVQGVGFRPFVYSLAMRNGLTGWVRNTSAGVDIEVDGTPEALQTFIEALKREAPPLARIDNLTVESRSLNGFAAFEILHSEAVPDAFQPISPDVCICPGCLGELFDPHDRRYRYPFINCTNCGPRFTIIEDIPYDRPKTTMAAFPMCPQCAAEYSNPLDRRFHAQPVACPQCGPKVWLEGGDRDRGTGIRDQGSGIGEQGSGIREQGSGNRDQGSGNRDQGSGVRDQGSGIRDQGSGDDALVADALDDDAIRQTQRLLAEGKIVAVKGLGGFHLACDATQPMAVAELRQRKLRVDKPFALMMPDIATIESHCMLSEAERAILESRERPIVILSRRPESAIASEVAPGQDTLGVMLPYTPLHYLLFADYDSSTPGLLPMALVMTSGNLSEEPIASDNAEARARLSTLADAFLMHDRPIRTRCDDSVVRIALSSAGETPSPTLLRRARGYAPFPIHLPWDSFPLLATGAELKNTFCLTRGRYAFLSHHIGDLENYETLRSFEDGALHFERLFRIRPEVLVCDMHPDYLATRYALERAEREQLLAVAVQHHHAHIAACMVEHGLTGERPVIGVAFDGTGFGDDSTIWGSEFLLADYRGYERIAHLAYILLPGGDRAVREPWRCALAWLDRAGIKWRDDLPPVRYANQTDPSIPRLQALRHQMLTGVNAPLTCSMGRLFDAAAALAGVRQTINYEAQAAIEFEAIVDPREETAYPFEISASPGSRTIIEPSPLLLAMVADIRKGLSMAIIAARFHNGVAQMVSDVLAVLRKTTGVDQIILSGGVWQNMVLLTKTVRLLREADFRVYLHSKVPPNDGGLSLGQAAIGIQALG